jgi:hypothetical protein
MPERLEVQRAVAASAGEIFAVLTDPRGHVAIDSSGMHGQLDLGHVYGYRLEPIEEGTLVTSYYDWSGAEPAWKDAAIFPVIPESALRATLGILARTVAPGQPRPPSPA